MKKKHQGLLSFFTFILMVDDFLLAASTASTVFNFLVIFCAFKLFRRNGDTMHLFIINMTLGDFLLTVFCHPNEFLMRKHTFLRHIHLCAVIHFCNWLGLAVSGLSLTLLNVDKLIYFCWSLRYDQTMSKQRAAVFCFFIWSISLGFVSYVWFFEIVYVTADCILQMSNKKKYFYEIFMIMFCVLPVTSSLVVSTYLFKLTRQKQHAFGVQMRSLVFIFATTAWTSFSLLPYRIFNICRIHLFEWNLIECEQRDFMNWLAWMLIYLLTLNPIINPLITAIIYAPYRITLKKLFLTIPIRNRLNYKYRGENLETSYLSVHKIRTRSKRKMTAIKTVNNLVTVKIPITSLSATKKSTTAYNNVVLTNKKHNLTKKIKTHDFAKNLNLSLHEIIKNKTNNNQQCKVTTPLKTTVINSMINQKNQMLSLSNVQNECSAVAIKKKITTLNSKIESCTTFSIAESSPKTSVKSHISAIKYYIDDTISDNVNLLYQLPKHENICLPTTKLSPTLELTIKKNFS